jgi:lipopolysaccharide/colanic/teichoic acid biosynthesis glycosyltransferase
MATRPIDVALAAAALVPAAPLCLAAAAGIWLCEGRPVLYCCRRVGQGGRPFTMYKLRTMRVSAPAAPRITSDGDRRVFAFGAWLRRWKIDELPQLLNVLRGDMAIIGPRPEDPAIVDRCYSPLARETLAVRPGLASPGSIYNFTHGERQLAAGDAEAAYVGGLLPRKLALDLVYVRAASLRYDLRLMCRAAFVIAARGFGRRAFPDPPELPRARQLERQLQAARASSTPRASRPTGPASFSKVG